MKRVRLFQTTKDLAGTHGQQGRLINMHDAVLGLILCIGYLGVQCWASNWWVFIIGWHIEGATCKQVRPFHPFGHARVMLAIVDCEVEEVCVGISISHAAGVEVICHMLCLEFALVDECNGSPVPRFDLVIL